MINRPATKIDLCLEDELAEYEEMKIIRKKDPSAYQDVNTYANFFNNLDQSLDDNKEFYNVQQSQSPKEFNLGGAFFSNDSGNKPTPKEIHQFTPDNK